jgi:hypothetical protein
LEDKARFDPEYAIPDVHGDPLALRRMLDLVPKGALVVFLGDIVSKGGDSLGAMSYLEEQSNNYDWRYLWGNHDLMLLRAVRGSLVAKARLFSQDQGTQILEELGEHDLARRAHAAFLPLRNQALTIHGLGEMKSTVKIANEVQAVFDGAPVLKESLSWMVRNFRLFYSSPAENLYLHAGVPADRNGKPRLSIIGLSKLEQRLKYCLQAGGTDEPLFEFLDKPEYSPLRMQKCLRGIKEPRAFCESLGVRAVIVGHSKIETSNLEKEPFPIIRHDFGAAKALGGTPSVLEFTSDGTFISRIWKDSRWESFERGAAPTFVSHRIPSGP